MKKLVMIMIMVMVTLTFNSASAGNLGIIFQQLKEYKAENEHLNSENDSLYQRIAELESQIEKQNEPWSAGEVRKFSFHRASNDHPNHPNIYGVQTNFFIHQKKAQDLIDMMNGGTFDVTVTVTTPQGDDISIRTLVEAELEYRKYYDKFIHFRCQ